MQKTRGRKVGQSQKRYAGDLVKTTSIRIDEDLRNEAEDVANSSGLTFGQFVRQSLRRNIDLHKKIEQEIVQKTYESMSR